MDIPNSGPATMSFEKPSELAKNSTGLLHFPCAGNREAQEELFASSNARLYQVAFRILSNPHDAEDAVQDSLLCAFRNLNQFRGNAKFSTWLHRIAINSSLIRLRKRKSLREFSLEPEFTGEDLLAPGIDLRSAESNPEEQCAQLEEREIISEALLELPGPFRTAIELCDLEGLPVRDAAEKLGVPLSTLKTRLHRSRRALKTTILRGRRGRAPARAEDKNSRWHRPVDEAREIEPLPAA